jgi:hypothetical protein
MLTWQFKVCILKLLLQIYYHTYNYGCQIFDNKN